MNYFILAAAKWQEPLHVKVIKTAENDREKYHKNIDSFYPQMYAIGVFDLKCQAKPGKKQVTEKGQKHFPWRFCPESR